MAEENRVFLFEFRGRTEVITLEEQNELEIIQSLSNQSELIERDIQQEIKRNLPPGVNVETQIQFYEGSIEWIGIVAVLDWMARLAGVAEFIGILSKLIEVAIERVLKRWLIRRNQIRTRAIGPLQIEVFFQSPVRHSNKREITPSNLLMLIAVINTILLLSLLILQLFFR